METSPANPAPAEPPRDLISSERVRLLTSWKLWLPMLFVGLLLIAAAIFWPAYRRMKAMDLIVALEGEYLYQGVDENWLTSRLGKLGEGYRSVFRVEIYREIAFADFQSLTALNETEIMHIETTAVTPEWIEAFQGFHQLEDLTIRGDITIEGIAQLLETVPTLEELCVGPVIEGDYLRFSDLAAGGERLDELRIDECKPRLTIEGFPRLDVIWIDHMEDAEIIVRNLPALTIVHLHSVNEATTFTHDEPLEQLGYGIVAAPEVILPAGVESMRIMSVGHCSITGGEDVESLTIYESADITVADMSALARLEFTTGMGGMLTLQDLPELQHFILMTNDGGASPTVFFDGVDNLRAIDAPWWRLNDDQVAEICRLPRLEHLVMSRAFISPAALPMLMEVETLRFLRYPRYMYNIGETDYAQLRRDFPQPGIRIHGPATSAETGERWSPQP